MPKKSKPEPSVNEPVEEPDIDGTISQPVHSKTGVNEGIKSLLTLTQTRSKYPSLQERQLMYFRLDVNTASAMIELLEETGWTQTDAGTLMVQAFFLLVKNGVFQMLMEDKLYDSTDPKDLKRIQQTLKPVAAEIRTVVQRSLWKAYRHESRMNRPAGVTNAQSSGASSSPI